MYTRKWLSMSSQFYLIPKYESAAKSKQNKKFKNSDQAASSQPPRKCDPKIGIFVQLKKSCRKPPLLSWDEKKRKKSNQIILGRTIISINKKKQPCTDKQVNFKKDLLSHHNISLHRPRIAIFFHLQQILVFYPQKPRALPSLPMNILNPTFHSIQFHKKRSLYPI